MPFINRTVLFFWAAWLSVVVVTNVLNGLQALAFISPDFKFVSGNWQWINQAMDPLGIPRALQGLMFGSAIAWETLGAVLFWRALFAYRGRPLTQEKPALQACGVNLALWAAFQVLDEVFMTYQAEAVHRIIFGSQIVTILLLQLSPATQRAE